jgi:hypothetical protein
MYGHFYQYFLTCIDAINHGLYPVDVAIDHFMSIYQYILINTEWANLDRELIKQDLRTIAAAIFDHLKTKDGK